MYVISTDPRRKLVLLKITGLLTEDEVASLYRDEHAAIRAMGSRPGQHLALVDLTECKLQLQDVATAFKNRMGSSGKAKRLAMFTGNSLARMQARRIMVRPDAALFATRAEAEAWLFDEGRVSEAA